MCAVVVAHEHLHRDELDTARDGVNMEEALMPLRVLRLLAGRQHLLPLRSHRDGILHLALRVARVDAAAMEEDGRVRRIEVLVLQPAELAAVNRVGKIRAERLDIEAVCTAARLLIRREAQADLAVRDLRVRHEIFRSADDGRDAGLVICTQKRRAVRHHDVLALVALDAREVRDREDDSLRFVQHDIAARIRVDDLLMDWAARRIRTRVEMRDKADDRRIVPVVRRQRRHDVAVLVHRHLREADGPKLVSQVLGQHHLAGRRRAFLVVCLIRLCIEGNIVAEPLHDGFHLDFHCHSNHLI